jgi:hypothetical protein
LSPTGRAFGSKLGYERDSGLSMFGLRIFLSRETLNSPCRRRRWFGYCRPGRVGLGGDWFFGDFSRPGRLILWPRWGDWIVWRFLWLRGVLTGENQPRHVHRAFCFFAIPKLPHRPRLNLDRTRLLRKTFLISKPFVVPAMVVVRQPHKGDSHPDDQRNEHGN